MLIASQERAYLEGALLHELQEAIQDPGEGSSHFAWKSS